MEHTLMKALQQALHVNIQDISFKDNMYTDERFFTDSIHEGFAGWYEEEALVSQVDFVVNSCAIPVPGNVLDLACGHGRHAVLLAQHGYDVVGADISPVLIEYLNTTYGGSNLQFERRTFLDMPTSVGFDLILILGNSLSLLPKQDLPLALRMVRKSLVPGGRVFVQLDNRLHFVRDEAGTRHWAYHADRWLDFSEHYYAPEEELEKTIDTSLDLRSGTVSQFLLTKSLYDYQEIAGRLADAGLRLLQGFGDWDGGPVTEDSPCLLLVAQHTDSSATVRT